MFILCACLIFHFTHIRIYYTKGCFEIEYFKAGSMFWLYNVVIAGMTDYWVASAKDKDFRRGVGQMSPESPVWDESAVCHAPPSKKQ